MAGTKELKRIKKIYGEKFSRLCRDMFPVILEQEGVLLHVLENTFSHNCNSLYEIITENGLETEFKELIYSESDLKRELEEKEESRTPYEILDEAGYNLYECKTEEDIQKFRKYYSPKEILCTIYNGGRLNTRYCFFAVKKDVDEIKRENFQEPDKNDKYSTSVLSIQFTREKNSIVQIISRYNHTVINPNCTLGNDLDRLAPGLKQSFSNLLKERGLNISNLQGKEQLQIPRHTLANDGKYYKYNIEVDGHYYCPDNIVISDGEAKKVIEPEKGVLMDYFCLDLENKEIKLMNKYLLDSFTDDLKNIAKIEVKKAKENGREIKIYQKEREKPIIIEIDKNNQIVKYENQYLQQIEDKFLCYNTALRNLNLPKLQRAGGYFVFNNTALTSLDLPQLQYAGDYFIFSNTALASLNLPQLQYAGDYFLSSNTALTELNMPQLQQTEEYFLTNNTDLTKLSLPQLQQVGDYFLCSNTTLSELNLPQLQYAGINFLFSNTALAKLNLPQLEKAGRDFLYSNVSLIKLSLPELQQASNAFLHDNTTLAELSLPKLQYAGNDFLYSNTALSELSLPKLQYAGNDFLYCNTALTNLNLPKLQYAGNEFLCNNTALTNLTLYLVSELKKKLEEIVAKNSSNIKTITPTDIANLDKENHLTTSEIRNAKNIIEKCKEKNSEKKDITR